jgi:hypothetical protein
MHKSKTKMASRRGVVSARSGAQDSWAVHGDEWGGMGGAAGGWVCIVGACDDSTNLQASTTQAGHDGSVGTGPPYVSRTDAGPDDSLVAAMDDRE